MSQRRAAAAASLVVACLGGCALWPAASLPAGPQEAAPPSEAAAPAADATSAPAVASAYRVEIEAPDDLRKLLAAHLDLERFRGAARSETLSAAELDRLIAAAPAQARVLLETQGHFNATVRVQRDALDAALVRLSVEPGPQARIDQVRIEAQGDLQAAIDAGDAQALATLDDLRERWSLKPGRPFREADWSSAKSALLARLRATGYAIATFAGTSAHVDAQTQRVRLTVIAESGPLFRIGELQIEGLERYDERAVRRLADFRRGSVATEERLLDFQDRLQRAGLFEGVVVEFTPDAQHAADTPVRVRVRELPWHQLTTGVGISANTGPRVTLEHVGRRIFGLYATSRNLLELGRDRRAWEGELVSHPLAGGSRNLVAGKVERLESVDEVRTTWSTRLGRSHETRTVDRLYFAEVVGSTVENDSGRAIGRAVSGNYHWIRRDIDSVVLPTRGLTLSLQGAAGLARSNFADSGPFARTWGQAVGYLPLGESWYTESRLELGEVFARDGVGLPDTVLFRAGGEGSVRGYAYRSLGPLDANGVVGSGRVVMTSSFEIARPLARTLPSLWGAVFIDAGNAADHWRELDPVLGYGFGLRWRSPVGPLRVDLAYGQEVKRWRLHLSVGIAL
jgi:translocation and assembly module TamA